MQNPKTKLSHFSSTVKPAKPRLKPAKRKSMAHINCPLTSVAAIDMKLKSFETEMESEKQQINGVGYFQMPLHYPRYTMKDYQNMPEWMLDRLLAEYGLSATGDLDYKRKFAMGAFLWPDDFHANQKPKAYYGY
ncbi:hypothetical protein Golob_004933 [Gossypium lobatum]|uniref:DUF7722 domain-containing protein n=1 Tax=Gossypium lobatum TaxID=34289 RepID=A0A7J8N371_9ROSI|nr:hypothetical protein [Gossypium lobatum]